MTELDEWLLVPEALPRLRRYFRTTSALKHHSSKRAENGLAACDAVRMSPLGRLLVNPAAGRTLGHRRKVSQERLMNRVVIRPLAGHDLDPEVLP